MVTFYLKEIFWRKTLQWTDIQFGATEFFLLNHFIHWDSFTITAEIILIPFCGKEAYHIYCSCLILISCKCETIILGDYFVTENYSELTCAESFLEFFTSNIVHPFHLSPSGYYFVLSFYSLFNFSYEISVFLLILQWFHVYSIRTRFLFSSYSIYKQSLKFA